MTRYYRVESEFPMDHYETYRATLSKQTVAKSGLFLQAVGLHLRGSVSAALLYLHTSVRYFSTTAIPRGINLWIGLHAPGLNKPPQYKAVQGREVVKMLNAGVREEIRRISPQGFIADGTAKFMAWYNVTVGTSAGDERAAALPVVPHADCFW
jgi:hypothetical protein